MDWLAQIDNLFALLAVVVVVVVMGKPYIDSKRQRQDSVTELSPPVHGPGAAVNGSKPISTDGAKLLIAEHVQNCPRMARMEGKLDALIKEAQDMRIMIERRLEL